MISSTGERTAYLAQAGKQLALDEIAAILEKRPRPPLGRLATVMFTSGSTGSPKGVSFSEYHIISKRFARGAALPDVGQDELLVAYLPLFHTFGRYLEMLGMIYWHGTYVFAGNPSADALFSLFPRFEPTGFISVPLRWAQLFERCQAEMSEFAAGRKGSKLPRAVTGGRLRWGLSAAGYLDPSVFRFFNRHGIALCSGFGMTEATGGITMTPPGEYVEDSTGILLPGLQAQLSDRGEMQVRGHYIARYLEDAGPGDIIPYPDKENPPYWLATGDIFQRDDQGHFKIIDRLKDIYKNNKGQTIAPRRVEQKFEGVPGIKRTFLVGDGRPYNILFIVPDEADPLLKRFPDEESRREYFHQLITKANQDLAPFERVINFTLLPRDFQEAKKEITPKGSLNRKIIEANFAETINRLYKSQHIDLKAGDWTVRLPRWLYRDKSILEDDIVVTPSGLENRSSRETLPLGNRSAQGTVRVGDLLYPVNGRILDLGIFCRQPLLWAGNPSLVRFAPVKDGWSVPFGEISPHPLLPDDDSLPRYDEKSLPLPSGLKEPILDNLHRQTSLSLFGSSTAALAALEQLETVLLEAEDREAELIRSRLESLAGHPEEKVRSEAYRILLLDEPTPDYSNSFPAFIRSGKTFLSPQSMEKIAFSHLEERRLEALRRRLFTYRVQLDWPVSPVTRQQFVRILLVLSRFAASHPEFYHTIRAEMASWILHSSDPELAENADYVLTETYTTYEKRLEKETPPQNEAFWKERLVFEDGIADDEKHRMRRILTSTTFLKQSILLAFNEERFDLEQIPPAGIWISLIEYTHQYKRYRLSVNTKGRHFDLQLVLVGDLVLPSVTKSVYWLASISGFPLSTPVLPRLGCYRPRLGAWTVEYVGGLTVWEKIRQYATIPPVDDPEQESRLWRKLFIRALAAYFRGWYHSGYRIVPGAVSPKNVYVPEQDFHGGTKIVSIAGWFPYEGPLSLVRPLLQNFFFRSTGHYPASIKLLDESWIFQACYEAFPREKARSFLKDLAAEMETQELNDLRGRPLVKKLKTFLRATSGKPPFPLPLDNAIDRYRAWITLNPTATASAREQTIMELYRLYRLGRYPEILRYYLYRHTYFAGAEAPVKEAFDHLLQALEQARETPAVDISEISELHSSLRREEDMAVFSRLVFPSLRPPQRVRVLRVGESREKRVIFQSDILDRTGSRYVFREPLKPVEIGRLIRLFFDSTYPMTVSEEDRYFVVTDQQEQLVGGICYRISERNTARLEGIVVARSLRGRGLGAALLEEFCLRMLSRSITLVSTQFYQTAFFLRNRFQVDQRWGALVRHLSPEPAGNDTVQKEVIEQTG